MVRTTFSYPLPNDGDGYKFTHEELVDLLTKTYEEAYNSGVTDTTNKLLAQISTATSNGSGLACQIDD